MRKDTNGPVLEAHYNPLILGTRNSTSLDCITIFWLTILGGKKLQMDVSKILSSNEIYFQKFVEIIPISFQPVVVLEILLYCWSFDSHRVLWGYFEAPLSPLCAAARTCGSRRISCSSRSPSRWNLDFSWNLSRIFFTFSSSQVWAEIRTVEFFLNG